LRAARSLAFVARVIVAAVVCAGLAGCRAASYSAPHAVFPVLVGPVRCIGCAASGVPDFDEQDTSDHVIVENGGGSSPSVTANFYTTGYPLLVLKAGSTIPDPCRGDVQITRIHVASYGAVLLGGAAATSEITVWARGVARPTGTCASRPWPYSGPGGIVPFDWSVSPEKAGAAPAP
jgi:hypothetical protein